MLVKLGMKQNNKLIIGITGGSGSGKSVVSKAAESLGFIHIDTDKLGHQVILKPNKAYYDLINTFGKVILNENNEIDRKKLGDIVFSSPEKLELLNKIVHPAIVKKTKDMLSDYTIIDGAVIYKTPEIMELCDFIISVINSDERRIEFICKRDSIDELTARKRIKSQPDNDFYKSFADIVIESDCELEDMFKKSVEVIKRCIGEKNI